MPRNRHTSAKPRQRTPQVVVETVEVRQMLSAGGVGMASYDYVLRSVTSSTPKAQFAHGGSAALARLVSLQKRRVSAAVKPLISKGSATAYGLTPAQIRGAYGVGSINFSGITGNGAGQTIAIIDAGDYTNAASDLTAFDSAFGLAAPASFTKVNQNGGTSLPAAASNSIESALDVQWAHVIAPAAAIVLVECNSLYETDLFAGVSWARASSTASVVSMSFGGQEDSSNTNYDGYFTSPSSAHHLTYVASTGDNGAYQVDNNDAVTGTAPNYPAVSPNVVAVGGTNLAVTGASYRSETGWGNGTSSYLDSNHGGDGGGGGGISTVYSQPSYQSGTVSAFSTTNRTIPDVALDADPRSGVPIYDSSDYGVVSGSGGSWIPGTVGGTSLSAPLFSGLIAVVNQGRALQGLNALDGATQTLPAIYALSSSDYHDVTTGNNGYAAGTGYDLVTGRGTPIANLLVSDLASVYSVSGRVFQDNNGNGVFDGTDSAFSGQTVYLDLNNNGTKESSEPSAITSATGQYAITDPTGTYTRSVRVVAFPSGYIQVPTPTTFAASRVLPQTVNLAFFPTVFSTSAASTIYTLQSDPTGLADQILINGTLTYSVPRSALGSTPLTITTSGTGDGLVIDGTNGNPVPTGGVNYTGVTRGAGLIIDGTASANDAFVVNTGSISFNGNVVTFSNVPTLILNPGAGTDSLLVNSGSVSIAAQSPGLGILARNFSNISIASNASTSFVTAAAHTDRMLVQTTGLTVSGSLDLGGNDLLIHNGNLSIVTALLGQGYNNGNWNGGGISSSAANGDTTHLTALGAIANTVFGQSGQPKFDGINPLTSDILVKYTYYGDANLDGKVDGSDYSRIDNGYLTNATGWFNGDFNYDTRIDGSDYSLIDNTYNTQPGPL